MQKLGIVQLQRGLRTCRVPLPTGLVIETTRIRTRRVGSEMVIRPLPTNFHSMQNPRIGSLDVVQPSIASVRSGRPTPGAAIGWLGTAINLDKSVGRPRIGDQVFADDAFLLWNHTKPGTASMPHSSDQGTGMRMPARSPTSTSRPLENSDTEKSQFAYAPVCHITVGHQRGVPFSMAYTPRQDLETASFVMRRLIPARGHRSKSSGKFRIDITQSLVVRNRIRVSYMIHLPRPSSLLDLSQL